MARRIATLRLELVSTARKSPEPALADSAGSVPDRRDVTVRPGRAADFQKIVDAIPAPKLALELVSGGARPTWMILRPASTLAESLETEWLPDTDAPAVPHRDPALPRG